MARRVVRNVSWSGTNRRISSVTRQPIIEEEKRSGIFMIFLPSTPVVHKEAPQTIREAVYFILKIEVTFQLVRNTVFSC